MSKKFKLILVLVTSACLIVLFVCFRNIHNRPNILLITIDALRQDHLSCYGYKRNTSPNIDNIAKEGVLFTQAISQACWTWPSMYSLATSTYPSTHGVYFWDQFLQASIPTLPEILKRKGFYTGFISGHGGLAKFKRGFRTFEDVLGNPAQEVTQKAIKWLQKNQGKTFFLWIHYMDAHDRSIGFPEDKHLVSTIAQEELNTYILRYDKAISYVDSNIGFLLRKIKELGLYNKTMIIISADHGEQLCEHGLCFVHGTFLWDSDIRIPLIIHYPNLLPQNKRVAQQVQQIDILPTICDILEVKSPVTFEGISLLSLIRDKKTSINFAFSEHKESRDDLSTGPLILTRISVRSSEWKLIYSSWFGVKSHELYNIKADPEELNNLFGVETEQYKILNAGLEAWLMRPRLKATPLKIVFDDKTHDNLKSLGYIR